jgi:hypothetical protein
VWNWSSLRDKGQCIPNTLNNNVCMLKNVVSIAYLTKQHILKRLMITASGLWLDIQFSAHGKFLE